MDKYETILNDINKSLWDEVKFPMGNIIEESKLNFIFYIKFFFKKIVEKMNKDLAKIIPSHNRPVTAGNKKESIKRVSTPKEKIKIEKNNDKENPNLSKTLSKKENKNDLKISEIKSAK